MEIKRFSDFIICPIPAVSELDQAEIEQIVTHTHNTWQHDRPIQEIRENTIQGKRAEIVIENILRDNSTSRFLAYDKMRRDNFNKHAPFDGIIYRNDITTNILQSAIDRINNDVISIAGDSGTITVETREYLETSGIYTIEIKSSLLQHPRDYRCINGDIEVKATSSLEYIDNKYSNDNAKKDLSLFGLGDKFDYSKPVELIKKLVKAYYKNDALILDFFAGSGTTAQAVLRI